MSDEFERLIVLLEARIDQFDKAMKTAERRAEQAISALRDQVRQLYEETLRLQKVLTNTVADEREQCNQRINGVELRHAAEISYLKGQIEALQQTIRATRRRGDPA